MRTPSDVPIGGGLRAWLHVCDEDAPSATAPAQGDNAALQTSKSCTSASPASDECTDAAAPACTAERKNTVPPDKNLASLWHRRLGHPSAHTLRLLSEKLNVPKSHINGVRPFEQSSMPSTSVMIADALTKALGPQKFVEFLNKLLKDHMK